MHRERNSVKLDMALTFNNDIKDFIIRMLRHKIADMDFERDDYLQQYKIAQEQKRVNLSNGKKYSDMYKKLTDRVSDEIDMFYKSIEVVKKMDFPKAKSKVINTEVKPQEEKNAE